jgi:hypothetical protein
VPPFLIDVHGLAGEHDCRSDVVKERQELAGIRGGEAERVDKKVGAVAQDASEGSRVVTIGCMEPRTGGGEVIRHP